MIKKLFHISTFLLISLFIFSKNVKAIDISSIRTIADGNSPSVSNNTIICSTYNCWGEVNNSTLNTTTFDLSASFTNTDGFLGATVYGQQWRNIYGCFVAWGQIKIGTAWGEESMSFSRPTNYVLRTTFDGTTLKCYVDGDLKISKTMSSNTFGTVAFWLDSGSGSINSITDNSSTPTPTPTDTPTPTPTDTPTPTPTVEPTPTTTPGPVILPTGSEEKTYLHETCLLAKFETVPDLEYSTCTNDHPRCYKDYQGNENEIKLPVKRNSDLGVLPLFVYLKTNSFNIPLNSQVLGQSVKFLGQGNKFSFQLRDDYWTPYNHNSLGDVLHNDPNPYINTTSYSNSYYTLESYRDFENIISTNDIANYFNQDNYKTILVVKNFDESNGVNLKNAIRCVWYRDNNPFGAVECNETNMSLCSQYKDIVPPVNSEPLCELTDIGCHLNNFKTWFLKLFIPDTDNLAEIIGSLFTDFEESIDSNVTSIISAPLAVIGNLTTATCSPLNLPLPFVNKNLQLPCFRPLLVNQFPEFFVLYDLVTTGVISYYVVLGIFKILKNTKDPDNDKIEVMDI